MIKQIAAYLKDIIEEYAGISPLELVSAIAGIALLTVWAIWWTVRRVLRPVDNAAKQRNMPFRFSVGDFLCLFWVVQLPLAFVFRFGGQQTGRDHDEATETLYWLLTVMVWAIAPLAWITCARVLSKAGVGGGVHRFIFLGLVLPIVYYGLFPFIGISINVLLGVADDGWGYLLPRRSRMSFWILIGILLIACGYYTPWMLRRTGASVPEDDVDEIEDTEP